MLRHKLWLGIVVGVAFRVFAYALLYFAIHLPRIRGITPALENVKGVLYWSIVLCGVASGFWIPFAAGFLSAYWWRVLKARDYVRPIQLSAVAFVIAFKVLAVVFALHSIIFSPFSLFALAYLDIRICGKAVHKGNLFWNGRLGRQFLGDFSTRDEEDNPKNSSEGLTK